jgi:hypothetical protein
MAVAAGVALTVMGAMDLLRHRIGGVVSTVMLVIEVIAIIGGIAALFLWARVREKQKRKS